MSRSNSSNRKTCVMFEVSFVRFRFMADAVQQNSLKRSPTAVSDARQGTPDPLGLTTKSAFQSARFGQLFRSR